MTKVILILLMIIIIVYILTRRSVNDSQSCTKSEEHFTENIPQQNENGVNEHGNEQSEELPKDKTCELEMCNAKTCGNKLHPIMDPEFNMREVAKQCLLLEDHLNNAKKRCIDCIRKHFLIIDGLLEESVSLEKDNNQRNIYRNLFVQWIDIERDYSKNTTNDENFDNISKRVRTFRKPLVEQYFDAVSTYSE